MGEKNLETEKTGEKDLAQGVAGRGLPTPAWVVIAVAVLVVGVLAGHFLLGGAGTVSLAGRTTLGSGELDTTIATYTQNGTTTPVTAREVLQEVQGSENLTANDDGTYDVPSARDVLSYVQNEVILADAAARGLTASDDEVNDFVTNTIGATDLSELASNYGISEDAARSMVEDAVVLSKLQDEVVTTEPPTYPTAPTEPEDGKEDEATAEYGSYVTGLLGDEWDAEADDWARTDGTYYATLSGYDISNDSATYAAASAAYSVAASAYQEASTKINDEWTSYTSGVLSKVSIQLGSLAE